MKKLLHIIASPRGDESRTLRVSETFLDAFGETHPDWVVEPLDLSKEDLPSLTVKRVDGKYVLLEGRELHGVLKEAWHDIVQHIGRFLSADGYLISTPMWNFTIPYMLKQYIDIIVQPKYLFRYTPTGVEGLVKGRKMVVIASRGGEYVSPQAKNFDFQEPYLRTIFGYVGITDMTFITAQPVDMGQELQEQKIKEAQALAQEIGARF
jgi:FMN-dependent NADH-azoreductase